MKHNMTASYKNILLRPLYADDLESLRQWRNDRDLSRFLSPLPEITPESQCEWYERELMARNSYTFVIEETDELKQIVGSVALYGVDGKTAEFGRFLLCKEAQGKNIGFIANTLVLYIGFEVLGLDKVTGCVHQENNAAIITYLKSGFTICGNHPFEGGGYELDIIFEKSNFHSNRDFFREIITSPFSPRES